MSGAPDRLEQYGGNLSSPLQFDSARKKSRFSRRLGRAGGVRSACCYGFVCGKGISVGRACKICDLCLLMQLIAIFLGVHDAWRRIAVPANVYGRVAYIKHMLADKCAPYVQACSSLEWETGTPAGGHASSVAPGRAQAGARASQPETPPCPPRRFPPLAALPGGRFPGVLPLAFTGRPVSLSASFRFTSSLPRCTSVSSTVTCWPSR